MITTTLVEKAVNSLRGAVKNGHMFPKGSSIVLSTVANAHRALEECFKVCDDFTLGEVQDKLMINHETQLDLPDFRGYMQEHQIHSLRFLKGVTLEEVTQLAEALGHKRANLRQFKSFADVLRASHMTHVEVDEIEYVAVHKGEEVVQKISVSLDQSPEDVETLVQMLMECADLLESIPDEEQREEARRQVAKKIIELPTALLRALFDSRVSEKLQKLGLLDRVFNEVSPDKIQEILEESKRWQQDITFEGGSPSNIADSIKRMKKFIQKTAESNQLQAIHYGVCEELVKIGILQKMPGKASFDERISFSEQVERLLGMPDASLMEPAVKKGLPDLVTLLCRMGQAEPLQKLMSKMSENLSHPNTLVRANAVEMLCDFQQIFAAHQKTDLLSLTSSALADLGEKEKSANVYGKIVQGLQMAAIEHLLNWRFEECVVILRQLQRHAQDPSPLMADRRDIAARALDAVAQRGVEVLGADLCASSPERQKGAYLILSELDKSAVEPLLNTLEHSADPRARQMAIQVMNRLGSSAKERLLKELHVATPLDVLLKLIPLFRTGMDASGLPTLLALLQHPDASVRRQVIFAIAPVQDPRVDNTYFNLLKDADEGVAIEAVRALRIRHPQSALPVLMERLRTGPASIQEEICMVLGEWRDAQAIPALARLLQAKRFLWKTSFPQLASVRVRAIWALGHFPSDPLVAKALNKAKKDSERAVQQAAVSALAHLAEEEGAQS